MNKEELRNILNQPYQFENWKRVIDFTFPNVAYLQVPIEIPAGDDLVESFRQVGTVRLNDGKNLAMFEVHVKPNVNIARNRVALRNLVAKYIDQERNHGVLAIYEKGIEDYRFTFTAKETDYEETTGNFVDKETEAKRYTYILGAHESCRTARDRFWELSQKKNEATIKDVEAAFSVEKLSKEFFTKYKEHYTAFVNYLNSSTYKISAFNNDEKEIRDFVKILLGRIVFLHFVQKKGWLGATDEDYKDGDQQFMYNLWKNSKQNTAFYQLYLVPLFFNALNQNNRPNNVFTFPDGQSFVIPYLGGGLFERDKSEPEFLTFPSEYFDNLFEFFNEYNFTIDENDPFENEVGIDPEMLGHIFENLLEDNKDKGAFYTPKPIVKYMCQESLIQYFITSFDKEGLVETEEEITHLENLIGIFVRKYEAKDIIEYDHILSKALYDVKICDPAIGSGAFPMGLLNEMMMLINTLHRASPDVVEELWKMGNWQPATVKKHIIQNSIYGVDIEKGAVDIARLRFWLSLIIDEERPTTLPSLDYKIVVGNSLIPKFENNIIEIDWNLTNNKGFQQSRPDLYERYINAIKEVEQNQKLYFSAENTDKAILSNKIRESKITLLIVLVEFQRQRLLEKGIQPEYARNRQEKFDISYRKEMFTYLAEVLIKLRNILRNSTLPFNHFDWQLDFPEILNPSLTKDVGFDIVIGNPPYINVKRGINEELNIVYKSHYITAVGQYDVYELFMELSFRIGRITAFIVPKPLTNNENYVEIRKLLLKNGVYQIVTGSNIFENAAVESCISLSSIHTKTNKIEVKEYYNNKFIDKLDLDKIFVQRNNLLIFNTETVNAEISTINKIEKNVKNLSEFVTIKRGVEAGKSDVSITFSRNHYKLLRGEDISTFKIDFDSLYIEFDNRDKKKFKELSLYFQNKILVRRVSNTIQATYDCDNYVVLNTIYCVYPKISIINLKFLTALLNSKLIGFWFLKTFNNTDKLFPYIRVSQLEKIPINTNFHKVQTKISSYVESIIHFLPKNDIINLKKTIDIMIYKLYDMNFDEVLIIDPEFEMSEEEYAVFELD